jgi:hypothetical protein
MIQEKGKLEANNANWLGYHYIISSYTLLVSLILQVDMINNLIRCKGQHERPSRPAAQLF